MSLWFLQHGSRLVYSGGPAETDPHRRPWILESSLVTPEGGQDAPFQVESVLLSEGVRGIELAERLLRSSVDRLEAAPVEEKRPSHRVQ